MPLCLAGQAADQVQVPLLLRREGRHQGGGQDTEAARRIQDHLLQERRVSRGGLQGHQLCKDTVSADQLT